MSSEERLSADRSSVVPQLHRGPAGHQQPGGQRGQAGDGRQHAEHARGDTEPRIHGRHERVPPSPKAAVRAQSEGGPPRTPPERSARRGNRRRGDQQSRVLHHRHPHEAATSSSPLKSVRCPPRAPAAPARLRRPQAPPRGARDAVFRRPAALPERGQMQIEGRTRHQSGRQGPCADRGQRPEDVVPRQPLQLPPGRHRIPPEHRAARTPPPRSLRGTAGSRSHPRRERGGSAAAARACGRRNAGRPLGSVAEPVFGIRLAPHAT